MRAQFIRGEEPKKSLKIGNAYFEEEVQKLKKKIEDRHQRKASISLGKDLFLQDEDFADDRLIVYLFKKDYDKWKEKSGKLTLDQIKIWKDTTSGNSSIIKISAPGIRETTLLRGETYYELFSDEIIDLLKSDVIKQKISDSVNEKDMKTEKLGEMIYASSNRKGLEMGSRTVARNIAERLIDLLK